MCGIACRRTALERPDTILYLLKQHSHEELLWGNIGEYIEIKSLELNLDYTTEMHRFQFLQISQGDTPLTLRQKDEQTRAYLKQWASIIESTKQRQMQIEDMSRWPPPRQRPWEINCVEDMPVVIWVKKQIWG